MKLFIGICIIGTLSNCSSENPWKLDTIACGNKIYDSSRLIYQDPNSLSPLRLEFLKLGTTIDLFLNLTQYSITPLSENPSAASIQLTIADQPPFEEIVPLLKGQMRLHLPKDTSDKIVKALQQGLTVDIVVNGFQETIRPEYFTNSYEKFSGDSSFLTNLFKRPAEYK